MALRGMLPASFSCTNLRDLKEEVRDGGGEREGGGREHRLI